jgi:hypothetical protein
VKFLSTVADVYWIKGSVAPVVATLSFLALSIVEGFEESL